MARVQGVDAPAMRNGAAAALVLVSATLVVLAAGAVHTGAAPSASASPAGAGGGRGADLYGRDCASCHGPSGQGSFRGPPLMGVGAASAHYMLDTGRMPIAEPDEPVRRRPPFYDDADQAALVAHVAGFGGGPPIPSVDPGDGDLGVGGQLYRLHCAACHSATGIGGALALNQFAPPVLEASPTVVAEAMLVGPGAMPAFGPDAFSDGELDAIVAYVGELQDPRDPGGIPLGRAGRVDEGLAAWAVGLAGLVVAAVWIGKRR